MTAEVTVHWSEGSLGRAGGFTVRVRARLESVVKVSGKPSYFGTTGTWDM